MASSSMVDILPSGGRIFTSIPDLFFIPEFVFGGLVWTLVASTRINPENPLGWVMFVSVFCFVMTTIWFLIFLCGANQSRLWPTLDVAYHFVAVVFYLSASVVLAYVTFFWGQAVNGLSSISAIDIPTVTNGSIVSVVTDELIKIYRLDIAAVVMSHLATLLYFVHTIFSAIRWRRS